MPLRHVRAPFHQDNRAPDSDLRDEIRMCWGTMAGCLLIGIAGLFYGKLVGESTHLSAFLVMAALYGAMGLERKVRQMFGASSGGSSGH